MLCLHVDLCVIGVTAKDDSSTLCEGEVLADDILDGEVVGAATDDIGTKHVESSLIIIGDLQVSIAINGYVIASVSVHKQSQGGIWCGIEFDA